MSTSLYTHEFTWSGEAGQVIATGSFDEWKSTLPLTKGVDGKFSTKLPIAYGEKITFKYVVDGNWQYNPNEPHETDASGNVNNVFTAPAAPTQDVTQSTESSTHNDSTAATIIPLPTTQTEEASVLPVPASVAETEHKVDSVAQIPESTSSATPAAAEESKTAAAPEAEAKSEEKPDLVNAATAGVAAIALGAAGLVGAGIAKVTGHDPVNVDPTPAASSSSTTTTTSAQKTEVPVAPTHTPASAPPTASLPTVPTASTVSAAVEKNEHVASATSESTSSVKPVVAVAGVGAAAVVGGASAAAVASKTGATAGKHVAESATFQQGEKYLKGFAAKAGKEKELHDVAVKADGYLAQAKAEGAKRYAEGEQYANQAYDKAAETSFGKSAMHALGLDKKHPSSTSTPTVASTTAASPLPKVEIVADPNAPHAPSTVAQNQTLGSTTAVTDPHAPVVSGTPQPAPAVVAAGITPSSPSAKTEGFQTAPSTPLKSLPATPSKAQSGLGHGAAPGSETSTGGKVRKPSFFKRLLGGGSKSSSPSK